jgi:hypothetical protein
MGASALAYTQRRADASPLWALVSDCGEAVERVWEERFEAEYGPWRPHWRQVIEGFLECGDLACGFARVRCGDCGNEYLVPFSCKRKLCPSCEARRRTWARLLARVYGVDALACGRCGGRIRIISFITDPEVIERILRHRWEWGPERTRGPPVEGASGGRAAPESRARRVVVDEYAQITAQEFAREAEGRDAGTIWEGSAEAERGEWDSGA